MCALPRRHSGNGRLVVATDSRPSGASAWWHVLHAEASLDYFPAMSRGRQPQQHGLFGQPAATGAEAGGRWRGVLFLVERLGEELVCSGVHPLLCMDRYSSSDHHAQLIRGQEAGLSVIGRNHALGENTARSF